MAEVKIQGKEYPVGSRVLCDGVECEVTLGTTCSGCHYLDSVRNCVVSDSVRFCVGRLDRQRIIYKPVEGKQRENTEGPRVPFLSESNEVRKEAARLIWHALVADDILFKKPLELQIDVADIIVHECKALLRGIKSD